MPDLCELADVKTWLGITDTSSDAMLERLITATSEDFLNEIRRQDLTPAADYVDVILVNERLSSCAVPFFQPRQREVFLRHYPVNSVAKVTVDGQEIDAVDDPTTDSGYWFDDTRSPEDRQFIILLGFETCRNVKVEYNGCYDEIPPSIEQAVIEWIAFKRGAGQLQQSNQSAGAVKIGDYQETGSAIEMTIAATKADIPTNVQRAIDQYWRPVI